MVDVGAAFVAGPEAFECVQPREGPFYRPGDVAESGTVGGAAAGDDRCDAASADQPAVFVVVVAAVGVEPSGTPPGAADPPTDDGQGHPAAG